MTIRMSAMFEEHIRRIIYNWKSARRRELSGRIRKRKSVRSRKNGQRPRTRKTHISDEDEEEDEEEDEATPPPSPVRKSFTPRKVNAMTNGHASTSKSNGPVTRPIIRIRPPVNRPKQLNTTSSDENDNSDKKVRFGVRGRKHSDSEDSYKPNNRGKKIVRQTRSKGKQKKTYLENSDESEVGTRTRGKTNMNNNVSDDYSESDDEPLVNCINTSTTRNWNEGSDGSEEETPLRNNSRTSRSIQTSHDESSQSGSVRRTRGKRQNYEETDVEEDDSEIEEEEQLPQRAARLKRLNYRAMLQGDSGDSDDEDEDERAGLRTRRGKRPHYNEESDEESNGTHRRHKRRHVNTGDSDSNEDEAGISISSRGRVRKLTARAKAYLRE